MKDRVLLVEDEPELNRMIADFLRARGFDVDSVTDGHAALRRVFEAPPAVIVLDLTIPGLPGLEVARTVASQTQLPMIIVTARGEEEDRLAGFAAGVDDYLVKPFSLPELAARITAVLRRSRNQTPSRKDTQNLLNVGTLRMDLSRFEATLGDQRLQLTTVQFSILATLAGEPGRVFTRLQLLESFQSDPWDGYERTIDVHIKNIRKALETDPHHPTLITTVRGVGYRLEQPR